MKEKNWWSDPNNQAEIERICWWNNPANKENYEFPISVIKSDNCWVATCNDDTKKLLGDRLHAVAQGKTKEEAISKLFVLLRLTHNYSEQCRLNYQRFVPFRKGNWGQVGGTWFTVFGLHVYFRRGKGMKGGFYIPFTKLNISFSNEWKLYSRFKNEQKKSTEINHK